ncbi:MAG: condensation domain-containing protein, partial [Acidobacteriota bacterium]|nr:condensation domain-containing protein [Acidobacteriota bacterium]
MSDLAARLAELSPRRRELLLRQLGQPQGDAQLARIPRRPRTTDRFPLSFSQLREWILDQIDPGSSAYNMPGAVRIEGPFDSGLFLRVAAEIVDRHESLRTTFVTTEGEPLQVVAARGPVQVPLIDLQVLPAPVRQAEGERVAELERKLPFDLSRGPLLRLEILAISPAEHVLLFTMHHIISDGWSLGVFSREIAALYMAFAAGLASPLPELPVQYPDYA